MRGRAYAVGVHRPALHGGLDGCLLGLGRTPVARRPLLPPGRFYSKIPSTQDAVDAHPTRYVNLNYMVLLVFFFVCRDPRRDAGARHRPAVIKTLEALVVRVRDEAQEVVLDRPDGRDLRRVAHHT